jgi:hypothetical protein
MQPTRDLRARKGALKGAALWAFSVAVTLASFTYQDKTGPTYPLEGDFQTAKGTVHFVFLRSEVIGQNLKIMLAGPVPEGVTGYVRYRRYQSNDEWSIAGMEPGEFEFTRRGRTTSVKGIGAELPSLRERAGKYEYFVYIDDGQGEAVSVTGQKPIFARYKGKVPVGVLMLHIFVVFASMTLAVRTLLEAIVDGSFKWMLWATIVSLLLGAFVWGPLVQWYAFGVWWAGAPVGYDWTDNKVVLELAFWLFAAFLNRRGRRSRWPVYLAGAVTFVVYFIPHSMFGSEFDYRTGTGHGTAG